MEDFLGIIVAIFAVASWFFGNSRNKEDQKQKPVRKTQVPRPTQTPSGKVNSEQTKLEDIKEVFEAKTKQQLDSLKERLEDPNKEETAKLAYENNQVSTTDEKATYKNTGSTFKPNKPKSRLTVNNNLSKNALVESVIMAEILGPPKALQRKKNTSNYSRR